MMIICYKENINLSLKNLNLIIQRSNCNIKHALWLLECVSKKLNPTNTYIETINEIIAMLLKKDLKECINIRTLLYKILITNISGSSIIQDIMVKLCSIKKISHCTKIKIIKISSEYEHNITIGRREIIHLDGFIMNIILLLISLNNTS
jgi:replication factor C subunit 3/5